MANIKTLEEVIWRDIRLATEKKDSKRLAALNSLAQRLERLTIELEKIAGEFGGTLPPSTEVIGDSVVIEVTDGAIRQNYLSMTKPIKENFVPTDGSLFEVRASTGQIFKAKLTGNMLNARAEIRKFYQRAGVVPGQKVVFRRTEPGRYFLEPAKSY